MGNTYENMEFKKRLSPAEIAMNVPKVYQMMSPEWCAGYMKGYREGVNKEREGHNRQRLEEIYPEFFKDKEQNERGNRKVVKQKRSWTMTAETLEQRDQEVRNDLIVDIYKLINEHIIERYKVCYSAAMEAALRAEGFGDKRLVRVVENMEKQLMELARYVVRHDDNAIAKWCHRLRIDESTMQEIFVTDKKYRFEDDFGIDDLDIFLLEGEK